MRRIDAAPAWGDRYSDTGGIAGIAFESKGEGEEGYFQGREPVVVVGINDYNLMLNIIGVIDRYYSKRPPVEEFPNYDLDMAMLKFYTPSI